MFPLRLSLFLVTAALVSISATCVTDVAQRGPEGPWTGRVTNTGSAAISGVEVPATIIDASGSVVIPRVAASSCPSFLLPGETGAFELYAGATPPGGIPAPATEYATPLSAEFGGTVAQDGFGARRSGGLFAEVVRTLDLGRIVTVRVTNNSNFRYSSVDLCAVSPGPAGEPSVAYARRGMDRALAPGESAEFSLFFPRKAGDTVRLYPSGITTEPAGACCPFDGASEWRSVSAGPFSVMLPPGWRHAPGQGIDSLVGAFTGDGITLLFDYGLYSDPLAYDDDPTYDVRRESIAGREAKVAAARDGSGSTGVAFASVGGGRPGAGAMALKLTVAGEDLTPAQRDVALQIFRTIRFAAP